MVAIMEKGGSQKEKQLAREVRDAGELLTVTELAGTKRYWHVWSSDAHNTTYPKEYQEPVVGMLYDTMASFQVRAVDIEEYRSRRVQFVEKVILILRSSPFVSSSLT